jgi:hypothetical protein
VVRYKLFHPLPEENANRLCHSWLTVQAGMMYLFHGMKTKA